MEKYFYSGIIILSLMIIPFGIAHAQPEVIKSAHRQVIESVDKLSEVKKLDLNPEQKIQKELELKKIALDKVVTLSILETENFKKNLENLEVSKEGIEAELLTLKDKFLIQLEDYLEYFSFIKNGIKASNSLDIIQRIAGNFNEWREFSYNPEIKKILDFIPVFQNRSFLKVADYRFSKIASDLKKIDSAKLKSTIWRQFLNPAALSIKEARGFNNRALASLSEYLPKAKAVETKNSSDQLLIGEVSLVGTSTQIQEFEDKSVIEKLTIRELVISSLRKLREAYGKFLDLRDLVKSQVNSK